MGLKDKLLSQSGQFNYNKKNYEKLSNENSSLKKEIDDLSGELNILKDILVHKDKVNELNKNYCPICGHISHFKPYGTFKREKVICPHCQSFERVRLSYLLIEKRFSELFHNKNIKLLHFAPEKLLYNIFNENKNIDYYPVDLNPEISKIKKITLRDLVNMENIPYDDKQFDVIYNSHVLEHVPDDFKAIGELYRVLKKDGICIIMIPLSDLSETLEKEEYSTPELRKKHYGETNHLRKYGKDFKQRLESVGFNVEEIYPEDLVDYEWEIDFFRLKREDHFKDGLYVCTK